MEKKQEFLIDHLMIVYLSCKGVINFSLLVLNLTHHLNIKFTVTRTDGYVLSPTWILKSRAFSAFGDAFAACGTWWETIITEQIITIEAFNCKAGSIPI